MSGQLAVLGNGFDLACGLSSRYDDFFRWRYPETSDVRQNRWQAADVARGLKDLTIWDLVFLADHVCRGNLHGHGESYTERRERSVPWCDIETLIGMVVTDLCYSYVDHPSAWRYEDWIRKTDTFRDADPGVPYRFAEYKRTFQGLFDDCEKALPDPFVGHATFTQIRQMLKNELYTFERIFGSYLAEKQSDPEYRKRAAHYGAAMLGDADSSQEAGSSARSILSFNYTQPFDLAALNVSEMRNIHGTCDAPILGINPISRAQMREGGEDADTAYADPIRDERYPFTKSFRVLEQREPMSYHGILDPVGDGKPLDRIWIFGHGMGDADYTYFKTIFDSANLYDGSVTLEFLYTQGDHEDSVRSSLNESIRNIITRYAQDVPEADRRTDLLTKMEIEGRLTIRPLPEYGA